MTGWFVFFGGILIFAVTVGILGELARRQEDREEAERRRHLNYPMPFTRE
jgi:hypothetical protein